LSIESQLRVHWESIGLDGGKLDRPRRECGTGGMVAEDTWSVLHGCEALGRGPGQLGWRDDGKHKEVEKGAGRNREEHREAERSRDRSREKQRKERRVEYKGSGLRGSVKLDMCERLGTGPRRKFMPSASKKTPETVEGLHLRQSQRQHVLANGWGVVN
jgi:hypothetical protein